VSGADNEMTHLVLTLPFTPRTYSEPDLFLTDCFRDSLNDFQRKSSPIFDASSILISTFVRDILQELIWKIPVRKVKFNCIESGFGDRVDSSLSVRLDIRFDSFVSERTRTDDLYVGRRVCMWPVSRNMASDCTLGQRYIGRGDWMGIILDGIVVGHCAPMCPKLGDNETPFGVNGVHNLQVR
jgi:hypothetical protein